MLFARFAAGFNGLRKKIGIKPIQATRALATATFAPPTGLFRPLVEKGRIAAALPSIFAVKLAFSETKTSPCGYFTPLSH